MSGHKEEMKLAPMVQLGSHSGLSVDLDQCRFQELTVLSVLL